MTRTRRTFTFEDAAHLLLDRVGNYSDYLNRLILQHGHDWTEALAMLRERGWQAEEILAACDALGGHSFSNAGRNGQFLADELERAEEHSGHFARREVSRQRRARCIALLVKDPEQAHALATLVREYWLYNEDCQQAVRSGSVRNTQ